MKNEVIRQDHINGLSYKAIGEKYQIDARTAKRYVELNLPLSELEKRPFSSILDPYKKYIDQQIRFYHCKSSDIHRWLKENGCTCSYSLVNRYVQKKILEYEKYGSINDSNNNRKIDHKETNLSIQRKIDEEKKHVYDREM